jgi:hypothetical protein
LIMCPPKFQYACIDFDGEQCPYYHEGTCTQVEVASEAEKQGIPTPILNSASFGSSGYAVDESEYINTKGKASR